MNKILLALLGSHGDCVFATTLAHQIKKDHPDCHLIWAISEGCQDILRNNPHVDEVWSVPVNGHDGVASAWSFVEAETKTLLVRGFLKHAYLVQIHPDNYQKYDGTVRPSLFRSYDKAITVPLQSVMCFDEQERKNVENFIEHNSINSYTNRILFECTSGSGQSYVTPEMAVEVANLVMEHLPDTCFVLSSHKPIVTNSKKIISGHEISYCENALLSMNCTQLVGCGSGVSALVSTVEMEKALPTLQLLSADTSAFASFAHDFEYWGLDNSHFIEVCDKTPKQTASIIIAICTDGIKSAREQFHQPTLVHFKLYIKFMMKYLLSKRRFTDAARSIDLVVQRYGWRPELFELAKVVIEHFPEEPIFLREPQVEFQRYFMKNFTKAVRKSGYHFK